MDKKNNSYKEEEEQSRMTIRLPVELRRALQSAVSEGSTSSITAEIINRLKKSFDIEPLDSKSTFSLIRKHAAKIQDVIEKMETQFSENTLNREHALNSLRDEERQLLISLDTLANDERKIALEALGRVLSLLKKGKK